MNKDKGESKEKLIWDLYQKKCREDGETPSVKGFKEWTTSILKTL